MNKPHKTDREYQQELNSMVKEIGSRKNQELETIFEAVAEGIGKIIGDEELTLIDFNQGFLNIVGMTADELLQGGPQCRNFIHPDDLAMAMEKIKAAFQSKKPLALQYRMLHKNGHVAWVQANYVFTDELYQGRYPIAYFIYGDRTSAVLARQRYDDEMEYLNTVDINGKEHLLVKARMNLTKQVYESSSGNLDIMVLREGMTLDDGLLALADTALMGERRSAILKLFSPANLIALHAKGSRTLSLRYQRKTKLGILWVEIFATILQNPDTDDLICFFYTYDINDVKIIQNMIDGVVALDYDFISCIDLTNGAYTIRANEAAVPDLPSPERGEYAKDLASFLAKIVAEEDRERVAREMDLAYICAQLEKNDRHVCYMRTISHTGQCRFKKAQYSYLDRNQGLLMFTQNDITDIHEHEQRRNEDLRNALAAARQANRAKSDFLSRMSHEIRTPMNSIIGMSALAADCIDDPQQVADCIKKVEVSAHFLLGLINDILDMSRIESGKMVLKNEAFPFEELINSINTICYTHAKNQKVNYDAVATTFTEASYIGDATKLQQVLINIISNAIKFTPEGGSVKFSIAQEKKTEKDAVLSFTVKDTGIGISEEFLPHLFEPFEQGHANAEALPTGTGLGLAICQNLVNLMGGTISVNSIVNVGSEFIIRVPLGIAKREADKSSREWLAEIADQSALIVDDEAAACQQATKLLEDMGLKAQWVNSGAKAVDLVEQKQAHGEFFDIILVDWKMPGMDGMETVRNIRRLVGQNATIVIITAFDSTEIKDEAMEAGVNAIITKPLFKATLSTALEKLHSRPSQTNAPRAAEECDLAGLQVLLVEDNRLNIEVASRLLKRKNVAVDVAHNGIEAIEMFLKKPAGHYGAILMDIQMPVMDGITATRAIRQLKHEDAKTIPVIAMTANAFDEDIEKTKAAGMNAHLAKPINPKLLYKTLYEFSHP